MPAPAPAPAAPAPRHTVRAAFHGHNRDRSAFHARNAAPIGDGVAARDGQESGDTR
jgi:hypothetical protein